MINQIYLVGRVKSITQEEIDIITLEIKTTRPYKNRAGEYDEDIFDVKLYGQIARNTTDYIHEQDFIGIKGHLARLENQPLTLIADRVTFLTSHTQSTNTNTNTSTTDKGEI